MDARRGRDAERGRLQRAAYRRDATDADREALAAFERREAVPDERRVPAPPVTGRSPAPDSSTAQPSAPAPQHEPVPPPIRRRIALPIACAALLGAAVGAVGTAVVVRSDGPPALDVFTAPLTEPQRASASIMLGEFLVDLDVSESLPIAGPVLLATTPPWDVYGFLYGDPSVEGGQRVCMGVVGDGSFDGSAGSVCADREVFARDGLRIGIDAPGAAPSGAEAIWSTDGSVTITDGP